MVMEFDSLTWQQETPRSRNASLRSRPEWASLKARLLAARQARRVLLDSVQASRRESSGSFARPAARWLIQFGPDSAFINPTASTIRNAGEGNEALVVDETRSGDRG